MWWEAYARPSRCWGRVRVESGKPHGDPAWMVWCWVPGRPGWSAYYVRGRTLKFRRRKWNPPRKYTHKKDNSVKTRQGQRQMIRSKQLWTMDFHSKKSCLWFIPFITIIITGGFAMGCIFAKLLCNHGQLDCCHQNAVDVMFATVLLPLAGRAPERCGHSSPRALSSNPSGTRIP